ncbi:LytS/YhcK type 5TM receptor domain-containing protein [Celerinatantimonas sp. YJH-8]|uniref:LytS/YhcK type 5TM receptor domain-containing protein n=1 Tax=Celerinatantimonas sp. YJH-8 TaxID=3228714 RepID=UPI0038C45A8A
MLPQLMMLVGVFERAALILMVLFILTHTSRFQTLFRKQNHHPLELGVISVLFVFFAVFSTYTGIHVDGSLINVRIIAILSGGILFGPLVGIPAGVISGLHRYLIDIHGPTSLPCLITSVAAGVLATWIHFRCRKENYWFWGIIAGIICEAATMTLILFFVPWSQGLTIVKAIAFPMIIGTVSIGVMVQLVQSLDSENDRVAAKQAKLALDIANKTLPYFRENTRQSMREICNIILHDIGADAVAITDVSEVLAYVGEDEQRYWENYHGLSSFTRQALADDRMVIQNEVEFDGFHSLLIIPLHEGGKLTGTLKIYYRRGYKITNALREMAVGLSHVISTQLEVSKVEKLKQMATKAEFSALQNKINPHFLFNSLNAISSLIRMRPDEARELIARLADFLRYNLKHNEDLIAIDEELSQVRDYIAIEQARFGKKLTVHFDVDSLAIKIPSLMIQPLVENAIQHGIQPVKGPGEVTIRVKQPTPEADIEIAVMDSGIGIREEVIRQLEQGEISSNHIGLTNVNQRIHLLYGRSLKLRRLEPGTEVKFYIPAAFDSKVSES